MPPNPSAFLIGCFGVLALAACTGQQPVPDVRLGHAIVVERQSAELLLAPGPDGMVSAADTRRVKEFIDSWRDGGRGPLRVAMPERLGSGAQDRLLAQLAELVKRRDADAGNILPIAAAQGAAGVILSFDDFVAIAPSCAPENAGMSSRGKNVQTPEFGCATQRNIAAMVAHPADLIDPAASGDASAARGALAIQNHRLGEPTGARTGSDKGVVVSKAIE
jgi:pilus assembly protein CpaD